MIRRFLKLKLKTIKDYNKKIIINDCLLNTIVNSIDFDLFGDNNMVDVKITIGELLLLRSLSNLILDEHCCNIHYGYKS